MATADDGRDDGADDIVIMVDEQGGLQMVYSDDVAHLFEGEAEMRTVRASHVEPHLRGGWVADMAPVGGPALFADGTCDSAVCEHHTPFETRGAALEAEVAWLRREMGKRTLQARA